ncbi:snRNA-activating protein complex subunit 3, putative [Plasmodium chabaudi chabaudi]|uniref:snRNA-activating protein complex subunit 3, putative n=1 Tax=Plasmodium chabaudi chabaudi TaxID=31271 RepID=A0A4V0KBM6_PLACU|nr:snRNA-activating protein complex subunit 3, putative [Plasmodium chabaudi chabaudi]VTZ70228.1 snRNA-activating protein complex subunit 3, putative [Plasmodium chabaudi chabaudi]|eukprot:XP_742185.1 snRNA-activating protein complex subunit 3, putative [Plasmodium chabaudi chabaudi]
MDERKYSSFNLPIPHFPINLLFETNEYDFYKLKNGEGNGKERDNEKNETKNKKQIDDLESVINENENESESENEKLFMKYLKNIVGKNEDNNNNQTDSIGIISNSNTHSSSNNFPNENKENDDEFDDFTNKESAFSVIDSIDTVVTNKNEIKKNVHLFEKFDNIHIKEELKMEWIYHTTPKAFTPKIVDIKEFEEECKKIKQRLKMGYHSKEAENCCEEEKEEKKEENEEDPLVNVQNCENNDKIKTKFYKYLIKVLLSGVRTPNVSEIINHVVYYNCNNWQHKIDLNVLKKVANNSKKRKVLNRTKCYLDWLPKIEENTFSKYQIISKLKKKTMSKTFKLVCDFNNTILKSLYINQNTIDTFYAQEPFLVLNTKQLKCLSSSDIFIISVSFYHPIRGIKIAEFEILSTQTLANLTDVFFCFDTSNYGMPKFSGSVYYIDGILYPDVRDKDALDYSTSIINFYKNRKNISSSTASSSSNSNLDDFLKHPYKIYQDKAVLKDIKIPLYKKCCFLHQGNCEHRIVFSNVRQYNKFRDKDISQYPIRTFKPNIATKYCICCHKNIAQKIIIDSYLFKENPSYVCDGCFELFLLDSNGKPVDDMMKHFQYINDI